MKESKKAILEILTKSSKKNAKFENLVLNLALQKIDSDSFEFDGEAVYTTDKTCLVYCMSQAETFAIPQGVEVIGEMAFKGKKHLKTIVIPDTVREIGQDAFYDCDELDNVYIPAGVTDVKAYAFAECDKLKSIIFAGTPKHLSRHTFDDCDVLRNIFVPTGSTNFFRKELHFINGDTDYIVAERFVPESKTAAKQAETTATATAQTESSTQDPLNEDKPAATAKTGKPQKEDKKEAPAEGKKKEKKDKKEKKHKKD